MFEEPSPPRPVRLDGATMDVTVRRLHVGSTKATWNEVTFPPGWTRPEGGAFDVAEEVVWLEGAVTMGGLEHRAGSYCWFPAGHLRTDSRTAEGARAIAWFAGRPTWTPAAPGTEPEVPRRPRGLGTSDTPPRGAWGRDAHDRFIVMRFADVVKRAGPVEGTTGRLLRDAGEAGQTWLLEELPGGTAPAGGATVVPLDGTGVAVVAEGEALPTVAGRTLLRLPAA